MQLNINGMSVCSCNALIFNVLVIGFLWLVFVKREPKTISKEGFRWYYDILFCEKMNKFLIEIWGKNPVVLFKIRILF